MNWTQKGFFIARTDFDDPTRWAHKSLYNGFPWAVVQASDGLTETNTDNIRAWIREAQMAGLTVGLWGVLHTDPEAEAVLHDHLLREYNAAFWVANAEADYKVDSGGVRARAAAYVAAFAALQPSIPRGLSTFGAAGSPLGNVTDADAGEMDFKSWYDGGYQFLPQTFPYDLSEVMDHAAACGWPIGRVSPTLAIYDSAFGRTLEDWVPIAAAEGVTNYNIYLAEQTRTLQQDPNWQEGDPTPPPPMPDPPPVPPPSEGGLPEASACVVAHSGEEVLVVALPYDVEEGSVVTWEWECDAEVKDSPASFSGVATANATQQDSLISGVLSRSLGGHRAEVTERVVSAMGTPGTDSFQLRFVGTTPTASPPGPTEGWPGSLSSDACVDYVGDGSSTTVTIGPGVSLAPVAVATTMSYRYTFTIENTSSGTFPVVAGLASVILPHADVTGILLNSDTFPVVEGSGTRELAVGETPNIFASFYSSQGGLHDAHMRVCGTLEIATTGSIEIPLETITFDSDIDGAHDSETGLPFASPGWKEFSFSMGAYADMIVDETAYLKAVMDVTLDYTPIDGFTTDFTGYVVAETDSPGTGWAHAFPAVGALILQGPARPHGLTPYLPEGVYHREAYIGSAVDQGDGTFKIPAVTSGHVGEYVRRPDTHRAYGTLALSLVGAGLPGVGSRPDIDVCGRIKIISVAVPPGVEPDAEGICFSFTPEIHRPPIWTRVDDPAGI